MRFSGKTVLITGGSSGIGLEFARQLVQRGNTVVVTGRDQAALDEATRASSQLTGIVSDASDPAAVITLFEVVTKRFPKLDTIINNAGIMRNLRLAESRALTDVTAEVESNLNGPIWMVQQFLPHLQASGDGLIVNISSGLAFVPFPAAPVYCATKAAIHAYTRSLRAQLRGSPVRVVEVAPPGTETPLMRREFSAEMEGQKGMDPVKLVSTVIKAIESGKTEIAPGIATVLRIASRIAPGPMFKAMTRMSTPKASWANGPAAAARLRRTAAAGAGTTDATTPGCIPVSSAAIGDPHMVSGFSTECRHRRHRRGQTLIASMLTEGLRSNWRAFCAMPPYEPGANVAEIARQTDGN